MGGSFLRCFPSAHSHLGGSSRNTLGHTFLPCSLTSPEPPPNKTPDKQPGRLFKGCACSEVETAPRLYFPGGRDVGDFTLKRRARWGVLTKSCFPLPDYQQKAVPSRSHAVHPFGCAPPSWHDGARLAVLLHRKQFCQCPSWCCAWASPRAVPAPGAVALLSFTP